MWIINFHLGFSALLLAADVGIYCMFRRKIKRKVGEIKIKKNGQIKLGGKQNQAFVVPVYTRSKYHCSAFLVDCHCGR